MVVLLSAIALATTYQVELPVPSTPPARLLNHPATIMHTRFLAETTDADAYQISSHPNIVCLIEDGVMSVMFISNSNDWPDPFPTVATCSRGSDTVEISVVEPNLDINSVSESDVGTDASVTVSRRETTRGFITWKLPSGTYTTGQYSSTLDGVKCVMGVSESVPEVRVTLAKDSEYGTGTCTVPRPNTTPYVLTVVHTETP